MLPPLDKQPHQLELFQLTELPYTNAFEFYEAIPRFLAGGDKSKYITPEGEIAQVKRNADGTSLPIEKYFTHRGTGYNLEIAPTVVKRKEKRISLFPGVREEIIEFVIFKIAMEKGYFAGGDDEPTATPDNYMVHTTVYEIRQELKKRNDTKNSSFNHTQIMEALEVLSKTNYTITAENNEKEGGKIFRLFEGFTYIRDKNKSKDSARDATLQIRLNQYVGKAILAKNWRQIGYNTVIEENSFLGRWFRKYLSLRFTQADATKTFNIRLSTVINHSGISPYKEVKDGLKFVKMTLDNLDIVSKVTVEKVWEINPETKRKRLTDAKFIIWPSRGFIEEQIRANAHSKRLEGAIEGQGGQMILEPRRADYASDIDFQQARRAFLKAQADQIT